MFEAVQRLVQRARRARWANLAIVNLRILIGFAFVPAGLKKLLYQPFTDPANTGVFHDFLHAFYATGPFYRFVGVVQLTAAVLLMTQRFALVGALLALPVLAAILAFCWSTAVYPTAAVVTLMFLGTVALVVWDVAKWRGVFRGDGVRSARVPHDEPLPVELWLWRGCGAAILLVYGAVCLAQGEIYRPKGPDYGNPAFYVFPVIALLPVVTYVLERRARR